MPNSFSIKNFLHPAPARVQKLAALVKVVGGALVTATASEYVPPQYKAWLAIGGIVVAMVAESLEKMCPPATPPDEAAPEVLVAEQATEQATPGPQ